MEKLPINPLPPIKSSRNPPIIKTIVGVIDPAGARVPAEAVAIFAGRAPIVKVKLAVVEADVMVIALSPVRSVVGVQDQLPLLSAVDAID